MTAVFISYSHVDSGVAEEITELLSDLGVKHFRDSKNIDWGDSITASVRDALDTCTALLVIVSPASLKSAWVPYEIGHAAALRKVILPFLTHSSLDIPHYIRDKNHVTTMDQVRDYFANRFTKDAERVPVFYDTSPDLEAFSRVCEKLPDLIAEMKQDIARDDSGLIREFFILSTEAVRVGTPKERFRYHEDQHDNLRNQVDLLEEYGFVNDISEGRTPIYRMSEEFVELLEAM